MYDGISWKKIKCRHETPSYIGRLIFNYSVHSDMVLLCMFQPGNKEASYSEFIKISIVLFCAYKNEYLN